MGQKKKGEDIDGIVLNTIKEVIYFEDLQTDTDRSHGIGNPKTKKK